MISPSLDDSSPDCPCQALGRKGDRKDVSHFLPISMTISIRNVLDGAAVGAHKGVQGDTHILGHLREMRNISVIKGKSECAKGEI